MVSVDHHEAVFRLVMLGVVPTTDAARVLICATARRARAQQAARGRPGQAVHRHRVEQATAPGARDRHLRLGRTGRAPGPSAAAAVESTPQRGAATPSQAEGTPMTKLTITGKITDKIGAAMYSWAPRMEAGRAVEYRRYEQVSALEYRSQQPPRIDVTMEHRGRPVERCSRSSETLTAPSGPSPRSTGTTSCSCRRRARCTTAPN